MYPRTNSADEHSNAGVHYGSVLFMILTIIFFVVVIVAVLVFLFVPSVSSIVKTKIVSLFEWLFNHIVSIDWLERLCMAAKASF